MLTRSKLNDICTTLRDSPEISSRTVSLVYHIGERTARELRAEFARGITRKDFHVGAKLGRPRKQYVLLQQKVEKVLSADSTLTLEGARRQVKRLWGVDVSRATVSRVLRSMDWTYKRTGRVPMARNTPGNKAARKAYAGQLAKFLNTQILYGDETGLNLHTSARNYGWAPKGITPRCTVTTQKGSNFSLLLVTLPEGDQL